MAWDDGDQVAYHRPSGLTHLVNAATVMLVTVLLTDALDADTIARSFAPDRDASWAEHLSGIVAMLERLEQLGLIERA